MNLITNEAIAEVTRRIVDELDPEEIILFGSYAWGTPHKYSDIDLCVIVPDGMPNFDRIEWGVRARLSISDLMIDVDVLMTTRSVVEAYRKVFGALERKIVEEGRLLYERRKTPIGASLDR